MTPQGFPRLFSRQSPSPIGVPFRIDRSHNRADRRYAAGMAGIEPATLWLTATRSTG